MTQANAVLQAATRARCCSARSSPACSSPSSARRRCSSSTEPATWSRAVVARWCRRGRRSKRRRGPVGDHGAPLPRPRAAPAHLESSSRSGTWPGRRSSSPSPCSSSPASTRTRGSPAGCSRRSASARSLGNAIAYRFPRRIDGTQLIAIFIIGQALPLWLLTIPFPASAYSAAIAASGIANGLVNPPLHSILTLRIPPGLRLVLPSRMLTWTIMYRSGCSSWGRCSTRSAPSRSWSRSPRFRRWRWAWPPSPLGAPGEAATPVPAGSDEYRREPDASSRPRITASRATPEVLDHHV